MLLARWALLALWALPMCLKAEQIAPAKNITDLVPSCARGCFDDAAKHASCPPTNHTCMCQDLELQNTLPQCFKGTCSPKDRLIAMNTTSTLCLFPVRDRGVYYVTLTTALSTASLILLIERFAIKCFPKTPYGSDDWYVLATIIVGAPCTLLSVFWLRKFGLGRDIWTLQPKEIVQFQLGYYIVEIFYYALIALTKITMLFLYMRIFPSRSVQRTLRGTIIFTYLYGLAYVLTAIFQCSPINSSWIVWNNDHEGHCITWNGVALSHAFLSITLDFWIIAIPLSQLPQLNLSFTRKIWISLAFTFGTIVTIFSVLRLKTIWHTDMRSPNPTWDLFGVIVWCSIEINTGIWCACLPSLRQGLNRIFCWVHCVVKTQIARIRGCLARAGSEPDEAGINTVELGADSKVVGAPLSPAPTYNTGKDVCQETIDSGFEDGEMTLTPSTRGSDVSRSTMKHPREFKDG